MSVQLAIMSAQMWLGIVFQKRPHKFTFQELLDSNKGDETKPIPYVRGKWKTKPQRIWLGDFSARAVERDSIWTDYIFFGIVGAAVLDFITVGYTYYVGQAFALTWGPINRVSQVYVDDLLCAVPPTTDNAGGSLLLDFPTAFGGDQPPGQGGIYGVCDVIAGSYTQARNPYLQSVEGNIPALHGVAALIVRGRSGAANSGYFSANGIAMHDWQVEVMAWPDVLNTGNARLPDDSFNRIHAMYEWATNADFGAQFPLERIHFSSWRAAAETCYSDGLGFSGEINTGGNVGEVFDELRRSVDAEVYEHPSDGLKIKLIRKDYSIPSLPVLSEANCNHIDEYTPGDYADTFNRVTLNYVNSDNNYQPRPAVYEDPANFQIQQRVASKQIEYPGVASAELAQKLVTRDGRALAQPWPPLILNAGEIGRRFWPGDVYRFTWPNPLLSKIWRVHSRTPSVSYEGEKQFRLTATEDQYSIGLSVFGTPSDTDATNPGAIWATAPPSVTWDTAEISPDGLEMFITTGLAGELQTFIRGAVEFGAYAGGQYARVYVTPPGGSQSLTPLFLSPDANNKAVFVWPTLIAGTYQFCVQTYSLTGTTNGTKVCATIAASSFSVSPSSSTSPSHSASPSVSPSSSLSPSASVSPSSSESPSVSPSVSPSSSISPSPSSSASASTSPSSSISPSSSTSPSVSPSGSVSPSFSNSPSTSPSSSASPSTAVSDPSTISNLELWLKASAITGVADGAQITTVWPDSSGNGRDATAVAFGGVKPKYRASGTNSLPDVNFDLNGWFSLPNFMTGFTAGHVFVVFRKRTKSSAAAGNCAPMLGDWGSTTGDLFVFNTDQKIYDGTGSSVRKTTVDPGDITSAAHLYEVRTASGAWSNWLDGTQLFSTGTNTASFNSAPFVGHTVTNTSHHDGWVSEIIFYSRVLNSTEIATIKTYITDKYGLTLA